MPLTVLRRWFGAPSDSHCLGIRARRDADGDCYAELDLREGRVRVTRQLTESELADFVDAARDTLAALRAANAPPLPVRSNVLPFRPRQQTGLPS